ncbi:MAG: branched-chain amino acid aminotransferase [Alphaproteobacteria bacterium]
MALIPYDDRDGWIWFDGKLVPWRDVQLHVCTHALHYASCVFEGERVYDGVTFKLREHTERLLKSADILGFQIPYTADQIDRACEEVIKAQNIKDGYLRPVAWRGSEMMGVSAQQSKIHLAIASWEWPAYFTPEARLRGIRMQISKWRRPAPDTAPTEAKAAGLYMICTLSKHKAEADGFNDALMFDYRGRVAEATGANIFFVKDGVLHTPEADCFLNGVTRKTVIQLAKKRKITVVERAIWPEELPTFDEAFLSGTAVEITPVREIDTMSFQVGSITRTLLADFDKLVREKPVTKSAAE